MLVEFGEGGGNGREPRPEAAPRPLGPALWRGWCGRCPSCGEGRLFAGFLAVTPTCRVCGAALHHHRADDLPPYLTIFVVGHVVVTGLWASERSFHPALWLQMAVWLPVTAILALVLLRPLKGAVVALQWALRMHGFAAPPSPLPPRRDAV